MAANYRLVGRGVAAAVGRRLAVAAAVRGCLVAGGGFVGRSLAIARATVGWSLAVAAAVRGCLGSVAVGWSLVSRSRLVGGSWLVGWSWLVG